MIFPGFASFLQAEEAEEPGLFQKTPARIVSAVEKAHDTLSTQVGELAERLDLFLGGLKTGEDALGTHVVFGGSTVLLKNGALRYDYLLNAKIDLPRTRDRFRLVIESRPDRGLREPLSPGARPSTVTDTTALPQEDTAISPLSAFIQFLTKEKGKWLFRADAGIEVDLPPDPFTRLRARRIFPFGWWSLSGEETLFWFQSIGPGASTQIDLDMRLSNYVLFRGTTQAIWKDRDQKFDLSQIFALFQELSLREVLTYKIGVTGDTVSGIHMKDWGIGIEYRRRIYKSWLYLSIEPALTFARANDFQADPSIRFSFDVTFGPKYVQ